MSGRASSRDHRRTWTYWTDACAVDLHMLTGAAAFPPTRDSDDHTVLAFAVNDDGIAFMSSATIDTDDGVEDQYPSDTGTCSSRGTGKARRFGRTLQSLWGGGVECGGTRGSEPDGSAQPLLRPFSLNRRRQVRTIPREAASLIAMMADHGSSRATALVRTPRRSRRSHDSGDPRRHRPGADSPVTSPLSLRGYWPIRHRSGGLPGPHTEFPSERRSPRRRIAFRISSASTGLAVRDRSAYHSRNRHRIGSTSHCPPERWTRFGRCRLERTVRRYGETWPDCLSATLREGSSAVAA